MRNVTDRIAFITDQVVLLPDVFRGDSYDPKVHDDYEEWRSRVSSSSSSSSSSNINNNNDSSSSSSSSSSEETNRHVKVIAQKERL